MASGIPDLYLNAALVNGLPTCVFPPASYHRNITAIVVGNGIQSGVKCYRGSLSSVPVAQNSIGANNTLSGKISLPAGQQYRASPDNALCWHPAAPYAGGLRQA